MSSAAQQVHIEHPIDLIEGLAASREWPFERGTEDDMNVCISGSHSDYHFIPQHHVCQRRGPI
jgi:hypothetical protein